MRSTFRTLFYLRKNQPKKEGTAAVMVKVSVNGESVQFNTKQMLIRLFGIPKPERQSDALKKLWISIHPWIT